MNRNTLAFLALASLLPLTACHGTGHEAKAEHEEAVATKPALSLSQGIAAAQKQAPNLSLLAAEIEAEGGKTICSVVLTDGKSAREVNIDAMSGALAGTEDEKLGERSLGLVHELTGSGAKIVAASQAITAAEQKAPGSWAFELRLVQGTAGLQYEIALEGGKERQVAHVSAADGAVLKIEDLEEDDDEGGEAPGGKG